MRITIKKSLLAATTAGLVAMSLVPVINADQWNKKTVLTVNEPIIAGNKVLQPGTYVWKLVDSSSNRNIVQIFNQSESKLETTVLAIPNYRLQPTGHTALSFYETPAGVPKAVRAWFYPGDNFGQEFAFPKKLVAELASARPVPLPAESYVPPAAPEPTPAAEPAPEPAAAPAPAPAPEPAAPAMQQASPTQQPAVTQEPKSLPKTASYGPLVGLVGLFSLSFFGVLTLATKKS